VIDGGPWLTVKEVAAILRISTATVYSLCAQGKLVHIRVSNSIRVAVTELAAFKKSR
jgi:excisionase family DNA binding protein